MGILAALISALFATSKDLLSKHVSRNVDGTVSTFASFAFALPYYALLMAVLWVCGFEDFAWSAGFWGYVLVRSVTDAAAEWFKMTAFQFGDLSIDFIPDYYGRSSHYLFNSWRHTSCYG